MHSLRPTSLYLSPVALLFRNTDTQMLRYRPLTDLNTFRFTFQVEMLSARTDPCASATVPAARECAAIKLTRSFLARSSLSSVVGGPLKKTGIAKLLLPCLCRGLSPIAGTSKLLLPRLSRGATSIDPPIEGGKSF